MSISTSSVLCVNTAAVSCSPVGYRLGGVGFGFWLTGKLRLAWVGAWHRCMGGGCGIPSGWWGCWIGGVGPEHWGLVLDGVW